MTKSKKTETLLPIVKEATHNFAAGSIKIKGVALKSKRENNATFVQALVNAYGEEGKEYTLSNPLYISSNRKTLMRSEWIEYYTENRTPESEDEVLDTGEDVPKKDKAVTPETIAQYATKALKEIESNYQIQFTSNGKAPKEKTQAELDKDKLDKSLVAEAKALRAESKAIVEKIAAHVKYIHDAAKETRNEVEPKAKAVRTSSGKFAHGLLKTLLDIVDKKIETKIEQRKKIMAEAEEKLNEA
jgi:hypothetical protein